MLRCCFCFLSRSPLSTFRLDLHESPTLLIGTSGNLSARLKTRPEMFLITPSGVRRRLRSDPIQQCIASHVKHGPTESASVRRCRRESCTSQHAAHDVAQDDRRIFPRLFRTREGNAAVPCLPRNLTQVSPASMKPKDLVRVRQPCTRGRSFVPEGLAVALRCRSAVAL